MHAVVKPSAVPFLDLTGEYRELEAEWFEAVRACGQSGAFILGKNVQGLEHEIAQYIGTRQAVACANGTDALVLALRALDIGPGDEVITTPFSFFATAEAITLVGARPVFADIEADSFNIDATAVEKHITPRTRALLPVHLYGHPADMHALIAIARKHGLKVIEDCAQAFGARIAGRCVGSMGDIGCFSFYPTKVLGCYGDGGMLSTNDTALADKLRALRNHGAAQAGVHSTIGYNSRLDEIQAALLRIKLKRIEAAIAGRQRVARAYHAALKDCVATPTTKADYEHVFNVYTVRSQSRDGLRQRLQEQQIASSVFYSAPMHLQPAYAALGMRSGDRPHAERAAHEVLSLPIFPTMTQQQIERVCSVLQEQT